MRPQKDAPAEGRRSPARCVVFFFGAFVLLNRIGKVTVSRDGGDARERRKRREPGRPVLFEMEMTQQACECGGLYAVLKTLDGCRQQEELVQFPCRGTRVVEKAGLLDPWS